jgi:signal transduction histidine kinase
VQETAKDQLTNYRGGKIVFKPPNLGSQGQQQRSSVFVTADKERINQVITNLLDNAMKFTNNDDTISIGIISKIDQKDESNLSHGEEIVVSIKDTGTGISPNILPIIH